MTYYVEPDYWVSGYAVGDPSGSIVFASGASEATGEAFAAGNYTIINFRVIAAGTGTILAAGQYITTYPGINLNAKSQTFASGNITSVSHGALASAQSDVRMTGRPFWENTTPASGTWTTIVPQAEGTGK